MSFQDSALLEFLQLCNKVFTSQFLHPFIEPHKSSSVLVLAVFSIFTANRIISIYSAVLKLRRIIGGDTGYDTNAL